MTSWGKIDINLDNPKNRRLKLGTKIEAIEIYLPDIVITNQMLAEQFENFNIEKIQKKVGIAERRVVREDETALDLAFWACQKLLKKIDKNTIDFLILCTQSPDYYLPTSACILQDKLALKKEVGAFDFNLGCSGFVYGLALAKSLINTGMAGRVLLVTSETYSRHIHPRDRSNRIIFGDAAAAVLIGKGDEERILNFSFGTDGSGYANLIVPNGGLRNPRTEHAPEQTDEAGNISTANHLYMNGPEVFNFTIEAVPPLLNRTLEVNGLQFQDIDYFVFHQANRYMIEYLRKKFNIPGEKFFNNMEKTGNTVSATIPIALKQIAEEGIIPRGSRVMLLGFGVGYSMAGTVIIF